MGVESYFHYLVVFLLYGTPTTSEKLRSSELRKSGIKHDFLHSIERLTGNSIER